MKSKYYLVFLLISQFAFSQDIKLGNEWIDFGKIYLKISISSDGLYSINYSELNAQIPEFINGNPQNFKLFCQGNEVAIKIFGEEDGVFNANDRIVFYAEKNKGTLDSLVYQPTSMRLNKYHSLFSDESAYFLVLDDSKGKRFSNYLHPIANVNSNTHLERLVFAPNKQYSFNNSIGLLPEVQQSYYEVGEGFTGEFQSLDSTSILNIATSNFDKSSLILPKLRMKLNGRSRVLHKIQLSVDNFVIADSIIIEPFGEIILEKEIPRDLLEDNALKFKFVSKVQQEYDWFSVTYVELDYPQILSGSILEKTIRPFTNQKIDLGNKRFYALNISNPYSCEAINSLELAPINNTFDNKSIVLFLSDTLKSITKFEKFIFNKINKESNYIIIRPESLTKSASNYGNYRSSDIGGGYKVLIISPNEIYNQFTFGIKNPIAVRRFAEYIYQSEIDKYVLLFGKALTFPDVIKSQKDQDLVPSFGYPASDNLLTSGIGLDIDKDVQTFATGRLNISSDKEAENYLSKVKEYESQNIAQDWKKNILHLSGGQNNTELFLLKSILSSVKNKAESNLYGAKILQFAKQTGQEIEPIDISNEVNIGVGMISYAGHGSANVLDFNFGYCSPVNSGYNNKGKYPIMYFNGCGVGNIFYKYNALSTDWLLSPEKGAIAVFANSFWSYLYPTQSFLNVFYSKLFVENSSSKKRIGDIHKEVNKDLVAEKSNPFVLSNINQLVLQGDPALRIFPLEKPDYVISEKSIFVKASNELKSFSNADSLQIGIIIKNNGLFESNKIINGKISVKGLSQTNYTVKIPNVSNQDTIYFKIKNSIEIKEIAFSLDPANEIEEYDELNNDAKLNIDLGSNKDLNVFPENVIPDKLAPIINVYFDNKLIVNNEIVAKNAKLNIELFDDRSLNFQDSTLLRIIMINASNQKTVNIPYKSISWNNISNNKLGIDYQFNNLAKGLYSLVIFAQDQSGNKIKVPLEINFEVLGERLPSEIKMFPNPVSEYIKGSYNLKSPENPLNVNAYLLDNLGKIIELKKMQTSIGTNEFYFQKSKSIPSGVYFTRLEVFWEDGFKEEFIIKVIK